MFSPIDSLFSSYWPPKNLFPVVDVRKESLALKDHPKMQIWEIVLLQYHQNCDILFQNINSILQLSNLFWHLNSWYYSLKELWFTIDAPGAIFAISSIDSWQFLQYFYLWHFWQFCNALGSQNTLGFQKKSWILDVDTVPSKAIWNNSNLIYPDTTVLKDFKSRYANASKNIRNILLEHEHF